MAPAGQSERVAAKLEQVGHATDAVELAHGAQVVGKRDGVYRLGVLEHLCDGDIDRTVGQKVEIVGLELGQHLMENVLRQDHGGQDRSLGRDILGHTHIARQSDDLFVVFSIPRRHRILLPCICSGLAIRLSPYLSAGAW